MNPEELRSLRQQRGWTLKDVAIALGVTEATLSRWERRLQVPPEDAQRAWEQLLTGQRPTKDAFSRKPRRRPRGIIPRLAEFFLVDVQAGINGWEAGWRELVEIGLTLEEAQSLGSDVELRSPTRIRISFNSRLPIVEQAKNILSYRKTVQTEERLLLPVLQKQMKLLMEAVRCPDDRRAVLTSGLSEMVRAGAPLVEAARRHFHEDEGLEPSDLTFAPAGAASVILDAVEIPASADEATVMARVGLRQEGVPGHTSERFEQAALVAHAIGVQKVAVELGQAAVIAIGASWAVDLLLTRQGVSVMSDAGLRYFRQAFWDALRGQALWDALRIERSEVESAWRRVMIDADEPASEKFQIGLLIWSWPEEL